MKQIIENHLAEVLDLLNRLQKAKIHYKLAHNQEDAITIEVAVPGQRWEIDCHANGTTDVEVFKSDGSIADETALDVLFRSFSD
jgi:hypothetical protein